MKYWDYYGKKGRRKKNETNLKIFIFFNHHFFLIKTVLHEKNIEKIKIALIMFILLIIIITIITKEKENTNYFEMGLKKKKISSFFLFRTIGIKINNFVAAKKNKVIINNR